MGLWKKLFGKGQKKTEPEAAHLRIECPRCGKSFKTEALLGVEFVMDECPYCHSGLMINLWLDKVIKVQPFDTQEEFVKAIEAAGRKDTEEEWRASKPQLEKDMRFVSNFERASALVARGQYEEA